MILGKLCFIFGDYNIVSRLSSKMAAFHPWQGWQYEKATKLATPGSMGISPCISSCIAWELFHCALLSIEANINLCVTLDCLHRSF